MYLLYFFLWTVLCFGVPAYAKNVISFDLKDLPWSVVLPRVEDRVFVKNKNILLSKKLFLQTGLGFNLTEPLYDNKAVQFGFGYNLTGDHALRWSSIFFFKGRSDSGQNLLSKNKDVLLIPYLQGLHLLSYEYNAYYGKISLSREWVMNITSNFNFGGGGAFFTDKVFPMATVGVNQSFYFTTHWAFQIGLNFLAYKGPDPTHSECAIIPGGGECDGQDSRASEDLGPRLFYHTYLGAGFVYLF